MNIETKEVVSLCNQIRGNDKDTGVHYLAGYLWASLTDIERERILAMFKSDLELEKNN
jgi:hypothetical protein